MRGADQRETPRRSAVGEVLRNVPGEYRRTDRRRRPGRGRTRGSREVMHLADLRKLAIKSQQRIRFPMKNGMDCLVDERGVALVPGLDRVPDFNVEAELES